MNENNIFYFFVAYFSTYANFGLEETSLTTASTPFDGKYYLARLL